MSRMRRLRLRVLALVTVAATAGGACSSSTPGSTAARTPATPARLATGPEAGKALKTVAAGKLTACIHTPHPPFEFEDKGDFDGIDTELVRAVAGRLALAPAFVDVPGDVIAALDAGTCDIVASAVPVTDELQKTVDFSAPYFQVDQSLLVRKGDEARYGDLPALAGKTIGVQTATAGADYAKVHATGAVVTAFPGPDQLFAALQAKQVDAVLQDLPVNAYHAKTAGDSAVAKTFTDGTKVQYAIAVRKGQEALDAAVADALTQVKSDDTYPTILRRFLGDTAGQI